MAEPEPQTLPLEHATGADIRSVAVIWTTTEVDGEPVETSKLVLFGMGEYEAAGLLRAAVSRLEKHNRRTIAWDDENIDEDEDEDYDDE